ncbi:HNH endonuclease [Atlantibacter hermannii]|uniref:HNH endonuclease n=1 Tax=Atlantibacter hermannii TaxID=565 RepID=UPI003B24C985
MALTKKQRAELRMKFGGRCAYCGCELPETGWHADHVEAALRKWEFGPRRANGTRRAVSTGEYWRPENDALGNLVPACAPCNLLKATYSVELFREQIAAQAERARQYSVNFRTAERFGQIQVTPSPVVFWFEKYQPDSGVTVEG